MARFLLEEELQLPSSCPADWQAHALLQLHLWARSLWLWGWGGGGDGGICSLGRDFAVILGMFWCSFGETI